MQYNSNLPTPSKPNSDPRSCFPPADAATWQAAAERLLQKPLAEAGLTTDTAEEILLQPIYHPDSSRPLAVPAAGTGCLIAQALPISDVSLLHDALLHDLQQGQNCINLVFDQQTRRRGEPGQLLTGGAHLETLADWQQLLEGIDFTCTPFYLQAYSAGLPLAAFLLEQVNTGGNATVKLRGAIETDPLGELALTGSLPLSLEQSWDELAALTSWTTANAPQIKSVAVHTEFYHNAGGSAVTDLAFTMATAVEYLRRLEERGLPPSVSAPSFLFSLAVGPHFFMEIAKLRALRVLWHQLLSHCGCVEAAAGLHLRAVTSEWNLTVTAKQVNLLRTTTAAVSALLGGCDSLQVGYFDKPAAETGALARRLARNTQLVLLEEAGLGKVEDPAAGSYLVEQLTAELASLAWKRFQKIENQGGMAAALLAGDPQRELRKLAGRSEEAIAHNRYRLVGTSVHAIPHDVLPPTEAEKAPVQRREASATLQPLTRNSTEESFTYARRAVVKGATLSQLAICLDAGGKIPSTDPLSLINAGEVWLDIRQRTVALAKRRGAVPGALLLLLGEQKQYRSRVEFTTGWLHTAGIVIVAEIPVQTSVEAIAAVSTAETSLVVFCGADDTYQNSLAQLAPDLKTAHPQLPLLLAGNPGKAEESFREVGIDLFLHSGENVPVLNQQLLDLLEVKS
ncbi:MAG: hypothetical protein ISR91_05040 [Candidatus Delongbacteria bacterium]|nr:hypothetical protein [Candidatus Delongbacteria bacterium]